MSIHVTSLLSGAWADKPGGTRRKEKNTGHSLTGIQTRREIWCEMDRMRTVTPALSSRLCCFQGCDFR